MRPKGTVKKLQRRRERAIVLLKEGRGIREVARMVGWRGGRGEGRSQESEDRSQESEVRRQNNLKVKTESAKP